MARRIFKDANQERVHQFHIATGSYCGEWPHVPPTDIRDLRIDLISEEFEEFVLASTNNDIVGVADALADLLYVVNGAAVAWGIDIQKIFEEIHRSNMTKIGCRMREDGKIIKGDGFSDPDLEPILLGQVPEEGSTF